MDGDTLNSQKLSDLVASEIASRLKLDEKSLSSQIAISIVDKFASFFEKNEEKYSSKKELANLTLAVKENTTKIKDSSKAQNKSESTTFFDNLKKIPEALEKKVSDSISATAYKFVPNFLKNIANNIVPKEEEIVPLSEEEVTTEGRKSALEHELSSEFAVKSFGESAISQLSDNFPDWVEEGTKKQTESLEKIQKAVEKMPEMLKEIKEAISDIETSGDNSSSNLPKGLEKTAWNAAKNLGKRGWNLAKTAATGLGTWATTPIASMGTAGAVGTVAAGVVGGEIIGGMAGEAIGSNESVSEALYGSKTAGKEAYEKYGTGITGFSKGAYDYTFGEGAEIRKQTADTEAKTAEIQKAGETKAQKAEEFVKNLGFKSSSEFKDQVKAGKTKPLKFDKEKQEWSVNENAKWNPDNKRWDLTSALSNKQQVPAVPSITPEPVKEAVKAEAKPAIVPEPIKEDVKKINQEQIPTINVIKTNPNKPTSLQEEAANPTQTISSETAANIQNNVAKQAAQVVNTEPKYLTASLNGGIVSPAAMPEPVKGAVSKTEYSKAEYKSPSTQFFDKVKKIPSIVENKIANKTKDFAFNLIPESVKNFASKFTDSSEDSEKKKDSDTEDVFNETSTEGRKSALEKEKKQKEAQEKPSEVKPKAENKKEEAATKTNVPAIVPEGVKDVAAVPKEKSLAIGTNREISTPDYNALLKEEHEKDPFKYKNFDNITSTLVKQGITSAAQYEQAIKEGKISKEFDQEFKKQYTRTSLGKERGEETFANKFENGLKVAQIQQAADVSPDQTNVKVSGTITEGKNVSDVSAKQIPSIVPEGVKNKAEGKEIKVPEWVPEDEESQQKYKDIQTRVQNIKKEIEEAKQGVDNKIEPKNDQQTISATPAQATNNFSETKTEKLDDKTLQEISKNTKLTNEALASLAGGVQALAKAIGQMSGDSGKPPVVINAGNQNPPNAMRNQADPTSTQFANLGNDIISSFRRGVEGSRFTPA